MLSEWLLAGSLEYVERFHRLPHCILAVGAVEKATASFRRLVPDARPITVFAESWRVKYTTVGYVCLTHTRAALMWFRDLKKRLPPSASWRLQGQNRTPATVDYKRGRPWLPAFSDF